MKKIFYTLIPALILFSCVAGIVRDCAECIAENKIGKEIAKEDTVSFPDSLTIHLYRDSDSFSFPEERLSSYNNDLGLAISGGGFRSYSCAIGQVSGLMDAGVWEKIGMLSVLSGSSWFSAPFLFAPDSISDAQLFAGAYTKDPSLLTVEELSQLETNSLGYPVSQLSDEAIVKAVCEAHGEGFPGDRLFNSILRAFISYYHLGDKHSLITWNEMSKEDILKRNSSLSDITFHTVRKNRPFFAISSTLYDSAFNKHHKMHHVETTPLYVGTLEKLECTKNKGKEIFLGGGYIENIGFNSKTPISMTDSSAVVPFPVFPYTLFDIIGTSGSAPGSIFDHLHIYGMMSGYNYWPLMPDTIIPSEKLSFVDGGDYENMALIPLLRRGFKKIIAFDNVDTPVGSKKASYQGVSYDIARLFGHKPKHSIVNSQSVQVFDSSEFGPLRDSLKATKARGSIPYYLGTHTVMADNPLGIDSYKKGETVQILWIANDLNQHWKESLPSDVQKLFTRKNHLNNFPNYKTVFQNRGQMFQLTPEQINLLANMWYYSVTKSKELSQKIKQLSKR